VCMNAEVNFVPDGIGEKPELLQWVGRIITAWPYLESQLGFSLANLLGTQAHIGVAIYTSRTSTTAQTEILKSAAEAALTGDDLILFRALLTVASSAWKERRPFAHGLWTFSPQVPNALLYVDPDTHHNLRGEEVRIWHGPDAEESPRVLDLDPKHVLVYTVADFDRILKGIHLITYQFGSFWQMRDSKSPKRDELRSTLSDEPRIQAAIRQITKADGSVGKSPPPSDPPAPTQE
jgi:hypothetical protein